MIYVDTSALGRAYFSDEPDHAALRALLLGGLETVATSSLTRVELASAAHRAARAGRIRDGRAMLDRFDADCGADGPIMRLRLRPDGLLAVAVDLVAAHALRVLDAVHLAVALTDTVALADEEPLTFGPGTPSKRRLPALMDSRSREIWPATGPVSGCWRRCWLVGTVNPR